MATQGESKRDKHKNSRVVIYPKDIQILTGRSYRYAVNLHNQIRTLLKKKKHEYLTIYEFADYTGIPPDNLKRHID